MAKPIKETPFLKGQDAIDFVNNNKVVEKISNRERQEIMESYEALKSIANFAI